jgi:hypothetical protein
LIAIDHGGHKMKINEKDVKIIVKNTAFDKSANRPDALREAVEVVHTPTGIRAESFSLSTTFANQAKCMQNLEIFLKAVAEKPVAGSDDPSTLCCPECGAIILPTYNFCPACSQAIAR